MNKRRKTRTVRKQKPGRGTKTIGLKTIFSPNFVKSRGFLMMLVLFVFILILAFFFGEGGLFEIIKARNKIEGLKKGITKLEKEKSILEKEIEYLRKNPMALEKKAREKLWLMKKNEKVVVIVKEKKKKKKKKTRGRAVR